MRMLKLISLICVTAIIGFSSCNKGYYEDTGVHNPKYNGTVLQYLQSKPGHFDSLAKMIKLAKMEEVFTDSTITFFAAHNVTISNTLEAYNRQLLLQGKDTIMGMSGIKPAVWKELLSMYVFKGARKMVDYVQVDTLALPSYPGQSYLSYQGAVFNIGVLYYDVNNVKYAGARQLLFSYISDITTPTMYWRSRKIASSDIQPTNGVVHTLWYSSTIDDYFGFDLGLFIRLVEGA